MDITRAASQLIEIGIALNAERDLERLMERILLEAMDLCSADDGTFYRSGWRTSSVRDSSNPILGHPSRRQFGPTSDVAADAAF